MAWLLRIALTWSRPLKWGLILHHFEKSTEACLSHVFENVSLRFAAAAGSLAG